LAASPPSSLYTRSLHDALPIFLAHGAAQRAVKLDRRTVGATTALFDQLFAFALLLRGEVRLGLEFLKSAPAFPRLLFLAALPSENRSRIDVDAIDVADLEPLPGEI